MCHPRMHVPDPGAYQSMRLLAPEGCRRLRLKLKLASAPPTMVIFDSATALFGLKPASSLYAHELDVRKAILLWPFLPDFECGGGRCERFASVPA